MLIRIFIKYYKFIILILMPVSVYANEIDHISNDLSNSVVENIDQFFLKNPQKKKCNLGPKSQR